MTAEDAELWMEALVPLMRYYIKRDPPQYKLYFRMYWGAHHVANPMGFLRARCEETASPAGARNSGRSRAAAGTRKPARSRSAAATSSSAAKASAT